MQIARVIGNAIATAKHSSLENQKLLVVQPLMADKMHADGPPLLAVDRFGAGSGEHVMLTSDGSAIKQMFGIDNSPIRWAVLGIVDGQSE